MGKTISLEGAKEANQVETSKEAAPKKAKTNKKNSDNVKAKVKEKAELMYNYKGKSKLFPEGVESAEDKKRFRASARKRQESFRKKIAKLKGEEKALMLAKANKWAARTYNKSSVPTFE